MILWKCTNQRDFFIYPSPNLYKVSPQKDSVDSAYISLQRSNKVQRFPVFLLDQQDTNFYFKLSCMLNLYISPLIATRLSIMSLNFSDKLIIKYRSQIQQPGSSSTSGKHIWSMYVDNHLSIPRWTNGLNYLNDHERIGKIIHVSEGTVIPKQN